VTVVKYDHQEEYNPEYTASEIRKMALDEYTSTRSYLLRQAAEAAQKARLVQPQQDAVSWMVEKYREWEREQKWWRRLWRWAVES
jgi:hypothetical protein